MPRTVEDQLRRLWAFRGRWKRREERAANAKLRRRWNGSRWRFDKFLFCALDQNIRHLQPCTDHRVDRVDRMLLGSATELSQTGKGSLSIHARRLVAGCVVRGGCSGYGGERLVRVG
ncbi:MAG TPA: hypothetical protein VGM90_37225 [Kofleriaceae bacterium]